MYQSDSRRQHRRCPRLSRRPVPCQRQFQRPPERSRFAPGLFSHPHRSRGEFRFRAGQRQLRCALLSAWAGRRSSEGGVEHNSYSAGSVHRCRSESGAIGSHRVQSTRHWSTVADRPHFRRLSHRACLKLERGASQGRADDRYFSFNDTRHTTATLLLRHGVPLALVQRILRHSDPRLTSRTYGHLTVEDLRPAIERLGIPAPKAEAPPLPEPRRLAASADSNPFGYPVATRTLERHYGEGRVFGEIRTIPRG